MTAPAKRGRGRPQIGKVLAARVPPEVEAAIKAEAKRLGTDVAALVREAIEAHLPRVRRRKVT